MKIPCGEIKDLLGEKKGQGCNGSIAPATWNLVYRFFRNNFLIINFVTKGTKILLVYFKCYLILYYRINWYKSGVL